MSLKTLKEYETQLYGCRFCPMCKPASEVGGVTEQEIHSTRGRALMLWRIAKGLAEYGRREAEIIYQSTLDSISESWCVNHYAVSGYNLAARREVVAAGIVPPAVVRALERAPLQSALPGSDTVLLAAEIAELGEKSLLDGALEALGAAGVEAGGFLTPVGTLAWALGDAHKAAAEAKALCGQLEKGGVKRVITDGPQTMATLKAVLPLLGLSFPGGIEITSLARVLAAGPAGAAASCRLPKGTKVFWQDSRSLCSLAEELASDQVLQPSASQEERFSGRGEVYDQPRAMLDGLGLERVFSVWSRTLSRSSGADDGLWLTYPHLAERLAGQRLAHARELGASALLAESPLDAWWLKQAAAKSGEGPEVYWLPEIFAGSS
jgi:hypothetical protein